jgi:hypothetical protein
MIPDYYDPRNVGELFLEDPARIAKGARALTRHNAPITRKRAVTRREIHWWRVRDS